jgi:hypothetical protein
MFLPALEAFHGCSPMHSRAVLPASLNPPLSGYLTASRLPGAADCRQASNPGFALSRAVVQRALRRAPVSRRRGYGRSGHGAC